MQASGRPDASRAGRALNVRESIRSTQAAAAAGGRSPRHTAPRPTWSRGRGSRAPRMTPTAKAQIGPMLIPSGWREIVRTARAAVDEGSDDGDAGAVVEATGLDDRGRLLLRISSNLPARARGVAAAAHALSGEICDQCGGPGDPVRLGVCAVERNDVSSASQTPGAVGAGAKHGACDGFGGARSLRRRTFAAGNGSPAHALSSVSGRLRRSAGRDGFSVIGEQRAKFGPRGPHGPPETAMRVAFPPLRTAFPASYAAINTCRRLTFNARHTKSHSQRTFASPRRLKRRKPSACLIQP